MTVLWHVSLHAGALFLVAADVEVVANKLRETEDLLAAVEAEKNSAEAQVTIPAAFFDQIFPWSFRSIDQLDRLLHICLECCYVVFIQLC